MIGLLSVSFIEFLKCFLLFSPENVFYFMHLFPSVKSATSYKKNYWFIFQFYQLEQLKERELCLMEPLDLSARERIFFILWEQALSVNILFVLRFLWRR